MLEAFYGQEVYKKSNRPKWGKLAEIPIYLTSQTPQQGFNECGVYSLKLASIFDGDKFVEHIDDFDVRLFQIYSLYSFEYLHFLRLFLVSCLQERSKDWKAEYMFRVIFHPNNKILLEDLPEEI
jgi:hypothetical protein